VGTPEGEAGDERPARPARASADVIVVGAGPAGLAAAVAARRAGAQVVLLDAQDEPGGQYWRHPPGAGPDRHHDPDGHVRLTAALAAGVARGGIDHRRGHQVWRVVAHEDGHAVHAVHAAGPGQAEAEVEVIGRALVLATGAYERALPFHGWDPPAS
jgi:NADPH-dependent 2,4-dienoyl-CoA reductase/sulfur reductase-like enzyme